MWHRCRILVVRLIGPLRERDFALFWAGTLVSLLGDGIYLVALPFTVLGLGGGAGSLSLVGLAWSLGMVGFLLAGGLLADRYDKRRQLLIADALRLVAVGTAGGLSLGGVLEIWHMVALGFVFGAGEGLTGPAMGAIVPELVPGSMLVQANALQGSLRPIALRSGGPGARRRRRRAAGHRRRAAGRRGDLRDLDGLPAGDARADPGPRGRRTSRCSRRCARPRRSCAARPGCGRR